VAQPGGRVLKKFVGDKKSLEARSHDGRIWEVELFDRGQTMKYVDVSPAELEQLARDKGMKLVPNGPR
jgi:hypothetical protein